MFTCSDNTQNKIADLIKEKGLTRVVVASCSPRTHEPIFRDTCKKAGLNPYLFEMANIRDQCSWVHMEEKEKATEKSKDLVRMAVARAQKLQPLQVEPKESTQSVLVIGGGIAGMTAAIDIQKQGFDVSIVEKDRLGGLLNGVNTLSNGMLASELVEQRKTSLNELGVKIVSGEVKDVEGSVGNFSVTLSDDTTTTFGAIVLATGARLHTPTIMGFGQYPNVITSLEFEKRGDEITGNVGFVLCVGANDETNPACSRFCCQVSIKQALKLAKNGAHPFVFYKDMRAFQKGGEEMFREAAKEGVRFIRYTERPTFDGKVITTDEQEKISIPLDHLILSVGMEVPDIENLRLMLKVPKGKDGFFLERHPKLGPVETNTDGIYVAGCASGPKELALSIASANGAAGKASGLLSKGIIYAEPITSVVDSDKCMSCGVCVPLCPYGAISLNEEGIADVNYILCKGCGVCAAACPKRAISMYHFSDDQLTAQIESFGGGD
jgi:heterodisulfide reductase subunit A